MATPSIKSNIATPEQMMQFYKDMLLIRRFEEKAGQLYGMGLIGGFCHLYIGQEAVVTGIQSTLTPADSVITAYRDHGHMLACGMTCDGVMAELTGRVGGYSKGKGGSMHMFSRDKKFYGGHGIVGATGPLGIGLAFAFFRIRRNLLGKDCHEQHQNDDERAGQREWVTQYDRQHMPRCACGICG